MALLMEAKRLEDTAAKEKAEKIAAQNSGLEGIRKYGAGKTLHAWDVEQQQSWNISVGERLKNDGIALCLYSDQCSEKVEAQILLEEVREHVYLQHTTSSPVPS